MDGNLLKKIEILAISGRSGTGGWPLVLRTMAVALLLLLTLAGGATSAESVLPWRPEPFTKTVVEEDVKVVLQELITRNGQQVIFRPGVSAEITYEFDEVPLESAFRRILQEHSLGYSYDPANNTVTIFQQAESGALGGDVFTARHSSLEEIQRSLESFRLTNIEVSVVADPRTNSLLLQGPRGQVANLMRILEKIDEAHKKELEKELERKRMALERSTVESALENSFMEVRVIPLRFASVGQSRTTFQGETITIPGIIDSLEAFLGTMEVQDSARGTSRRSDAVGPDRQRRPMVSVDHRTNSIIVQGSPAQVEAIAQVVERLDEPVPLVEIEVMIVDGVVDIIREIGINWGVAGYVGENAPGQEMQHFTGDATTSIATPNTKSGFYDLFSRQGVTGSAAQAGFIFRGAREVLNMTLEMMAHDNKLQTVASPRVITLNNQPAKITNSKNVNFVTTTGDGTRSDVKTVNSGITLDITPSVIDELEEGRRSRMVRLKISAKNSSITSQTAESVNTDEQEVQTNVILTEGATFVMGGLFNTRREEVESGVPGLKDVPILGELFRHRKSEDRKSETVFLITPKIHHLAEDTLPKDVHLASHIRKQKHFYGTTQSSLRRESALIRLDRELEEDE